MNEIEPTRIKQFSFDLFDFLCAEPFDTETCCKNIHYFGTLCFQRIICDVKIMNNHIEYDFNFGNPNFQQITTFSPAYCH